MNITELVGSLDEQQLGELGDALRGLSPGRLARVLARLATGNVLSNRVGYHLVMGTRDLLEQAGPNMTSIDLTRAEQQVMG
jgi:hypothetical protein